MVLFKRNKLITKRNFLPLCLKNGSIQHVKFMTSNTQEKNVHIELSNKSTMILSTGKYARFTSGSITATLGNTSVMTTVVRQNVSSNVSMTPLTVNYRQKAAAMGRIPTNFLRREMGLTDQEILIGRIIDRSLRPLFLSGYSYETQIVCNLLAVDGINDPDVLSINAASAALSISDIPWNGPVGAVRVGLINGTHVINPSKRELQQSTLNLVLSCTSKDLVVMMEGSANNIKEPELVKAIKMGAKECQTIVQSICELQNQIGKDKIKVKEDITLDNDVQKYVEHFAEKEIHNIFSSYSHDKISRDSAISDLRRKMLENMTNHEPEVIAKAEIEFHNISKKVFRSLIFETERRCDGRGINDLRNIECQIDLFRPLHGSAFFQRGQTQVLCTVTLDSIESSLKLDTMSMLSSGVKEKNFFLHYEFPPYAVNETGKVTGLNRREIGHGALAEKGLTSVIPKDYPFAIRLTSEVLESNGSSSMASVCGGSLALMDAGVPISAPVAGVAMGLICNSDSADITENDYRILTDISGIEDHFGDMDFKIAGTKKGFTALQVDVKIPGVHMNIIRKSIQGSVSAKKRILNIMNNVISTPAVEKKTNKPVVETIQVPIHQRGRFLGISGINLKKIFFETGVNIYPEDDTVFRIFAPNQNAMDEAKEMIDQILKMKTEPTLVFGDIYTAKIIEIREIGVMVTLYSSMIPTLLPNSQLDNRKIHHPSALGFNVGDEIQVKYFGRDPANGRIRLSRKVLQDPVASLNNYSTPKETLVAHKGKVPESTRKINLPI